jgi:hypothetical protein
MMGKYASVEEEWWSVRCKVCEGQMARGRWRKARVVITREVVMRNEATPFASSKVEPTESPSLLLALGVLSL